MSERPLDIVRRGYELFAADGFTGELTDPDFVWDMSTFEGWLGQPTYSGVDGARAFLEEWSDAWDDWRLELETLHEAGDRVVAVMRQTGKSRATGIPVDMRFAQLWTVRGGKQLRMAMYSDPAHAFAAAGIEQ